jgi:hypothetical protein
VDRLTWAMLCDLENINEAAAYLVLAQGTGRDNRSTSWSAKSLRKYAGISWRRGADVIQGLIGKGFIKHAQGSLTVKPRYELLTQPQVAEARLTEYERILLTRIRQGTKTRASRSDSKILSHLEGLGLIRRELDGNYTVDNGPSNLIWLPNTLVTGTEKGEDSPVCRLRRAGDIWTLRLLIDLYHVHNLRDDGGNRSGGASGTIRTGAGG